MRRFNALPIFAVTLSLCGVFTATQAFAGPVGLKKPGGGGGGGGGVGTSSTCSGPSCIDLTTAGSSGTAGGAIFKQIDPLPTGTGKLKPFLRVQSHGGQEKTEEGYSTSYRPFQYDEKDPLLYTHDLLLSDVGVFTIDGSKYREFILDINEDTGHDDELISLDKLMIFESATGKRHDFPSLGTLVYDLDGGGIDRWIKMDYSLAHGSGSGDMAVYIPDEFFHGLKYVYLYSRFGDHDKVDGGFEEWASRKGESTSVPEPASMLMLGTGLMTVLARRRALKSKV